MESKRIEILVVFVSIGLLIFSTFGLLFINPQSSTSDIKSGWKTNNTIIDGEITNAIEWQDATAIYINSKSILYVKNDNNNLYLCLDAIGDTTLDDGDFFRIHFDTGNDCNWTPGGEDGFAYYSGWFSGGMHIKENISGIPNDYYVHCSFTCDPLLKGDTSFSTSVNSNQNHQIYEMQIPLSIIGITPGDQIGFFVYGGPFDASVPQIYNIFPKNADESDMKTWAKLIIATTNEMGTTYKYFLWDLLFIILIIISIFAISTILINKYVFKRNL